MALKVQESLVSSKKAEPVKQRAWIHEESKWKNSFQMASTKTAPILKSTHLFSPNLTRGIMSRETTGDANVH